MVVVVAVTGAPLAVGCLPLALGSETNGAAWLSEGEMPDNVVTGGSASGRLVFLVPTGTENAVIEIKYAPFVGGVHLVTSRKS